MSRSSLSLSALPAVHAGRRARHGALAMTAGGLLLGTIGVFVQEAGQHPLTAAWCRCLFGVLALTAWGAAAGRLGELRLAGRAWASALGAGVLMTANWALFFAAIERSSIALATVVFHVQPLWVMAAGAAFFGERVTRGQVAGALLALAGLGLASGVTGGPVAGAAVGLCLAASLSYAGVTLIAHRSPVVGSYALAWWQCAVGLVMLAAWPLRHGLPPAGAAWAWLAGLGIIHTGLAYVLLYGGMARLPTARVALLQFVYPATAVSIDWLVYGHAMSPLQLAGVALMGVGLLAARREGPR